jgi:dihydrofolate reductase
MRQLILSMMVTLDGFSAGSDGSLDMFGENFADDELLGFHADQLRSVDAYIFGRVAYQELAQFWPTAGTAPSSTPREVELAELMNTKPKIVVSRSQIDLTWGPATVIGGDLATEIRNLKTQSGRDLALFAGATIASAAIAADLVDEYRLMVYPVAIGRGQAPFGHLARVLPMELLGTRTFSSGPVLVRYRPAAKPTP